MNRAFHNIERLSGHKDRTGYGGGHVWRIERRQWGYLVSSRTGGRFEARTLADVSAHLDRLSAVAKQPAVVATCSPIVATWLDPTGALVAAGLLKVGGAS